MKLFTILAVASMVFLAAQAPAQNGNGVAAGPGSGFGVFGPVDPAIDGNWLEFSFTGAGSSARGCRPADPGGLFCVPSSAGNSMFLDAPPWTLTAPFGGVTLRVTDAFLRVDRFEILDNAVSIGTTSAITSDPTYSCGSDPEVCFLDGTMSTGTFSLAAGQHSLTIDQIEGNPGTGYFRIDSNATIAPIDIKFCSNPNSFNCKKNGALPVTIFGTTDLDVSQIDIGTLKLCTDIVGVDCTGAPVSYSFADRGNPLTDLGAASCAIDPLTGEELDTLNPDGMVDLDVGFVAQEVVGLDVCASLSRGDVTGTLYLVGYLNDGTPIRSVAANDVGIDQLRIANK